MILTITTSNHHAQIALKIMTQSSPLAGVAPASKDTLKDTLITITPIAHARLIELRDAETERERLGLRLEILSGPG